MINPLQLSLTKDDGTKRDVIVEPVLKDGPEGLLETGIYKIYKDAFADETSLYTEPLNITGTTDFADDEINPDYLGRIVFASPAHWTYEGNLLSPYEQKQVAVLIE